MVFLHVLRYVWIAFFVFLFFSTKMARCRLFTISILAFPPIVDRPALEDEVLRRLEEVAPSPGCTPIHPPGPGAVKASWWAHGSGCLTLLRSCTPPCIGEPSSRSWEYWHELWARFRWCCPSISSSGKTRLPWPGLPWLLRTVCNLGGSTSPCRKPAVCLPLWGRVESG